MRILFYIILFVLSLQNGFCQTFEFTPNSKDTINYTHFKEGRKGLWILMGQHKPHTCYAPNQIAETGNYERNMKQGLWKEYYCNNMLKSEQVYVNGKVNGAVTLYYEGGKKRAQGTFKVDRWVNELQLFDESGRLLYCINFDEDGNRKQSCHYKNLPGGKRDSVMASIAN